MTSKIKTARLRRTLACVAASVTFIAPRAAYAATATMPWEGSLQRFVEILTGPTARGIGIVAIILSAVGMALSESGHAKKSFFRIILGLLIALAVSTFGLQFFGVSGCLQL